MPDRSAGWPARLVSAAAAVVLAVAVVGLALVPLTSAVYVRAMVSAAGSAELTGLGEAATYEVAEAVRRFVLDADAPALPATLAGRPAFDEAASAHLVDVREVLSPARTFALALGVAAAAWIVLGCRSERLRGTVARSMRWAAGALGAAGLAAAVAGLADFDALFAWFHSLFFADGTWTFPDSALLIRVFPLPFWVSSGAVWAALVLIGAGLLYTAGRRTCFTRSTDGV